VIANVVAQQQPRLAPCSAILTRLHGERRGRRVDAGQLAQVDDDHPRAGGQRASIKSFRHIVVCSST
jgi:hypothetical protein